jgi:hypothetical protein
MAFNFNGIAGQEVTISGEVTTSQSLPKPNENQTPVVATIDPASTSATTIYTASAGKTFYLTGFGGQPSGTRQLILYDTDGTTPILIGNCTQDNGFFFPIPAKAYTESEPVKVSTSQANGSDMIIIGYEE